MKNLILNSFVFLCSFFLLSQDLTTTDSNMISYHNDLDFYFKTLKETHPNPFAKISEADFLKELNDVKLKINPKTNLLDFYRLLSPLVSKLGDGHTNLYAPFSEINKTENLTFPFLCRIENEKITINEYFGSESPIDLPAELISINGISASEIIDKIDQNTSGESREYRLDKIANRYMFGLIFNLFFDLDSSVELIYKHNNAKLTSKVENLTMGQIKSHFEILKNQPAKKVEQKTLKTYQPFSLDLLDNKIALLKINSFLFDNEQDYYEFLRESFKNLKKQKTKNLIIDLRENKGGDSKNGDELLKYIIKKPFKQYDKVSVKYSQFQKDYYYKLCQKDSTKCSTYDYYKEQNNGRLENLDIIEDVDPYLENNFNGNVFLLQSLTTFSSGSNFAQAFKHYEIGKIIGSETGGQLISYGDMIYGRLPYSNLNISISTKEFVLVGAKVNVNSGVIPDFIIDRDKAFEFARKIILKK
jgi:hypothetical protein